MDKVKQFLRIQNNVNLKELVTILPLIRGKT